MSNREHRFCNEVGKAIIRKYEGLSLSAYVCPAGVWTIGYGHTDGVRDGDVVDFEHAERLLTQDLFIAESAVQRLVTMPLNDNQFAALCSWTLNLGTENLRASTLLHLLNMGKYADVPAQMMRWNRCKNKVLPGLTRRRRAEAMLWSTSC